MTEKVIVEHKGDETSSSSIEDSLRELPTSLDEIDPKIEASIRRKCDKRILTSVTLLYLFAFIDRTNIGNAKILGMQEDLDLERDNRMSICLTAFFITYILFEVPGNILVKKLGPKIALPAISFAFGLVTMCIGFCYNFGGLFAGRFFLGIAEAAIMPGISYTLGTFYRRHELITRVGIYASCASLAGAFGGLLAIGFSYIPPWGIMHTWRNIFFFEGILTMIAAVIAYFMLAKNPETASFLTEEERRIGQLRIQLESMTRKHEDLKMAHFKNGILNWNTIFLSLGLFSSLLCMNSIAVFMPSLLSEMGWGTVETQLLTVPPYALGCIICISSSILSDRFKTRGIFLYGMAAPFMTIGFAVLIALPDHMGPRYMAIFFATAGAFTGSPMFVGWLVDNTAGPMTRAIASAFSISAGSIGALISTWTYLPEQAPDYLAGNIINLVCAILVFVGAGLGTFYMNWENVQREKGNRDHIIDGLTQEQIEDLGHKHPSFRFTP
ncbi:major facilitator superfamily domain-containing protein [Zychaea mexicana]|uniref:major facilitator superfamily domain-containing protein n=1 Tax=Zychaea mexicana TaxID=64656 RepID=UPI0022FE8FCC|nr:major facilitator superfamily domain-containing protein [Zychaea mexicana]KAI9497285.1 major facilitator superfamily domain-containing protein [Zychaea mexicana]